jgi:signal transduction histidine kinase
VKRVDERYAQGTFFWIAALLVSITVVSLSYSDFNKETRDIETLFEAHVESVVALINEGTREAAASTSLIYELFENHLLTTAELLGSVDAEDSSLWDHLKKHHKLLVHIGTDETGRYVGDWGPIGVAKRNRFLEWMEGYDTRILVDDGPLWHLALACIRTLSEEGSFTIVCKDANELKRHRLEIGIGPLLKGVTQKDITYVTLQDQEGILATAPSEDLVSAWRNDPFLASALARPLDSGSLFRVRDVADRSIFEGLVPFKMADDSVVLLRVGIDGAALMAMKRNALQRFVITIIWTAAALITGMLLFFLVRRWQRRTAELNRRVEEEAASRRHWEDVGQMAATVAHEVRNPLNTMGMISERLKREFTVPVSERDEYEEMVQMLVSEGKRVEKVVLEFLDIGKPMTLEFAVHPLAALLQESLSPFLLRAEEERKQLIATPETDAEIQVDRKRFRQVMTNLLDNAFDAVEENGIVTVISRREGNFIEILIVDNGKGVEDKELTNVLKPFVSHKPTGIGLGLPLVRRIIEAHGGTFALFPNPHAGLTAQVRIPVEQTER